MAKSTKNSPSCEAVTSQGLEYAIVLNLDRDDICSDNFVTNAGATFPHITDHSLTLIKTPLSVHAELVKVFSWEAIQDEIEVDFAL